MSTPFTISPSFASSAGTGSDYYEGYQSAFEYGDINIGSAAGGSWAQRMARDVGVAIVAGLAIKLILERIK